MTSPQTYGEAIGQLIRARRELAGWSMLDLALEAFEDETKVRRINDLENGYVARPQAKTLGPIFETLNITEEDVLRYKSMPTIAAQTRDELGLSNEITEKLASIFELDKPDASTEELFSFLEDQARDLKRLRERVKRIQSFEVGQSNALEAAQMAIDEARFVEADEILAACEEIQQSERTLVHVGQQADIRAARGSAAQLSGKIETAAAHFRKAASYLDPFDTLTAHHRRFEYAEKMFSFGERYGKGAEIGAVQILDSGNIENLIGLDSDFGANYTYLLAKSLEIHGRRSGTEEGTAFLKRSVGEFDKCLRYFQNRKRNPKWTDAQNSMGIALWKLGERSRGKEGLRYFFRSTLAHRRALRFAGTGDDALQRAKVFGNLGLVLWAWGERAKQPLANRLLSASIESHRESLELRNRNAFPLEWAKAKNNLGLALQAKGERDRSAVGENYLREATLHFEDALLIRTFEDQPFAWAITQNNIGLSKRALGERLPDEAGASLIQDAIGHFNAATNYHGRSDFPYDWAICQENLAEGYLALSKKLSGHERGQALTKGLCSIEHALSEYDPISMAYDHGTASKLKKQIIAALRNQG